MRRGGRDTGTFSGDFDPPKPWRVFHVRLRDGRYTTDRSIGSLTSEELCWMVRCMVAELESRRRAKHARKEPAL